MYEVESIKPDGSEIRRPKDDSRQAWGSFILLCKHHPDWEHYVHNLETSTTLHSYYNGQRHNNRTQGN